MLQFRSRSATKEGTMAANVVFTDPGGFMKARLPKVSDFEDEQLCPGIRNQL